MSESAFYTQAEDKSAGLEALLTVKEVASLLRLDRTSAYNLITSGRLPHVRLSPKRIRVQRSALLEYIERCTRRGQEAESSADKAAV